MERLCCVSAFVCTTAGGIAYFVFGSTGRIDWMPDWFMQSPAVVSAKYPTPFSPGPIMVGISWLFTFLTNMTAQMYLYVTLPQKRLFPGVFYLSWILGAIISLTWAFTYDRELHVLIFVSFIVKFVLLIIQLIVGANVFHQNSHQLSTNFRWTFQYVIMDSVALLTTYISMVLPSMAIQAIGYKYSAGLEVSQQREWISFDTAQAIGAAIMMTSFLTWLLVDFVLFPKKSAVIRSIYPTYIFLFMGVFLSHYTSVADINRYNVLCLVLFFTSVAAFFLRYKIKGDFPDERKRS